MHRQTPHPRIIQSQARPNDYISTARYPLTLGTGLRMATPSIPIQRGRLIRQPQPADHTQSTYQLRSNISPDVTQPSTSQPTTSQPSGTHRILHRSQSHPPHTLIRPQTAQTQLSQQIDQFLQPTTIHTHTDRSQRPDYNFRDQDTPSYQEMDFRKQYRPRKH
jgi:hypothetical protein